MVRRVGQVTFAVAAVALLLGVALPRVAGVSWSTAGSVIGSVEPWQLLGLGALWLLGLWAYSFVMAASLPGLTKGQGMALNLVGSGVSNLVPFGGAVGVGVTWKMARQYGFSHRSLGLFTAVTGVWNVLARLALPVVGVAGLLAVGARVDGPVRLAALVAAGLCCALGALVGVALAREATALRVARWANTIGRGVAGVLRREAPGPVDGELLALRGNTLALLQARRAGLVLGMLGHVTLQGVLMWACLAAVGSELGAAEVTSAYALGRMLTIVVLTPGGTGFAETGAVATLIALGGDPATSLAGVLLFSFFTFVCEIPGAALAYGWHLAARHWRREPVVDPMTERLKDHSRSARALDTTLTIDDNPTTCGRGNIRAA
ncbi:hypothetical protein N803_01905 [Knoellia subterranea KCTC 19937]|uniref:Lysylphosphatidylglycerol synthetase n=2 Tax=Knoellia TaxID=136099 RepID=A0A0A0JRA4_9MICO|nr:hypothetical protein N803_01905 [Knoellia subterranea KCTC 19937]